MHPLILGLIAYAAVITVLALILIGRAGSAKRRQKQELAMVAPAAPQPIAPAPARSAYNPDALLPPVRHTAASRTRSVPAPQPQRAGMSMTDAFILGAVLGSFDRGSCSDSSGDDWCC
jgi:hypothetical protein